MELTDAERKRRSEAAKKMHQEGKIGGKQDGAGRPSKRAQAQVAEGVRDDAQKILKALRAALGSDSPSIKLKAALAMLQIESDEEEHKARTEQRKYERMDREALIALAQERIALLRKSGVNFEEVIESTARDVDETKQLNG